MMQENLHRKNIPDDFIRRLRVEEPKVSPEVKKEVWRNIEASTLKKKLKLSLFFRYAAVVALLVATTLCLYFYGKEERKIDYRAIIAERFSNGKATENVIIVLPNNEKIEIEEKNAQLILDTEGKISVNSKKIKKEKQSVNTAAYYQVLVPYGKTSCIVMSDGTKVWVNSGSRVIYPAIFSNKQREIYVEGEVYLEVARKQDCPFVLKTEELEVNVLGTSFNVSAYKNDDFQSVVLATGSVSVKGIKQKENMTIKPNQKYTFKNDTKQFQLEDVDILSYISWKYGFLIFQNEKLKSVLKKIERYYDKPIFYNPAEMEHITVSGKLDLKENIEETFRIISITAPISYTIEKSGINIRISH